MPGLSNYRPVKPEDYDESTYIPMPSPPGFGLTDLKEDFPDIHNNVERRYSDSLGFADLKRSAGDSLFHRLYENTPSNELDTVIQMIGDGGRTYDPTTIRELLDILKSLTPNEQQGP